MGGLLLSISFSVSVIAGILFLCKGKILKQYGSKMLYILSLLIAVRFIIPYSIQLPDKAIINFKMPWYIPVITFGGTAVCLLWQIAKYISIKRKIKSNAKEVASESVITQYKTVKERLFIDEDIPLLVSDNISTPMLLGIFKPCIIIPNSEYSLQETEMLLSHELIHYRSKDYLKKLFLTVVISLQWFNPFAWLLLKEFDNSLEMLCDEAVTKNKDKKYKKDYCYMLLNTSENKRSYVASTTYFSSKETLKMRISNIFSNKNKKSGTALIIASILSLAFASSLLCSCTVETPSEVKEEMSRIDEGISNEKNESSGTTEADTIKLVSVSEATADAEKVINEWNEKNGIFKFDNCNIMIPQIDTLPDYDVKVSAEVETPSKKYAQFKEIEKSIFGEDFFKDDEIIVVPANQSKKAVNEERLELSLKEYLSSDYNPVSIFACSSNEENTTIGMIDYQPTRIWYRKDIQNLHNRESSTLEDDYVFQEKYLINTYDYAYCHEVNLNDEYKFADGKASVSELISCASQAIEETKYSTDEKINYKPLSIEIYDRGNDTCAALLKFHVYYDDIPIVNIAETWDKKEEDEIIYKANVIGNTVDCYMYYADDVGELINSCADIAFLPTGSMNSKILSVESTLELLKNKLSNNIVYDVKTIQLGYDACRVNDDVNSLDFISHPFYNIELSTTSNDMIISVDAITGDMNVFSNRG